MKKLCICLILASIVCIFTSSCTHNKQKPNMVQAERKFAKYIEPQQEKNKNVVDLSEGPRLKYESSFGPKNLNFDIKIVDPY